MRTHRQSDFFVVSAEEATGRSYAGPVSGRPKTVNGMVSSIDTDNLAEDICYMSGKAESFQDLRVCQEAGAMDLAIFQLTKGWPKEEMCALTDRIRRSSRAVGANLAEAWAKLSSGDWS